MRRIRASLSHLAMKTAMKNSGQQLPSPPESFSLSLLHPRWRPTLPSVFSAGLLFISGYYRHLSGPVKFALFWFHILFFPHFFPYYFCEILFQHYTDRICNTATKLFGNCSAEFYSFLPIFFRVLTRRANKLMYGWSHTLAKSVSPRTRISLKKTDHFVFIRVYFCSKSVTANITEPGNLTKFASFPLVSALFPSPFIRALFSQPSPIFHQPHFHFLFLSLMFFSIFSPSLYRVDHDLTLINKFHCPQWSRNKVQMQKLIFFFPPSSYEFFFPSSP